MSQRYVVQMDGTIRDTTWNRPGYAMKVWVQNPVDLRLVDHGPLHRAEAERVCSMLNRCAALDDDNDDSCGARDYDRER